MWHLAPIEGEIRSIKVSDGPAGARGERWFGGSSACVPCGTALGATWSPEIVAEVAGVLAREARRKGADVLLAPTVNLHRHPLAGRNFECMSEDPELTAALAVDWIRALQSRGVAACVKHLVANDQETDRHGISVVVDEAVLRELYLRPFEAAVRDGGTWSVMSAYNRLGGIHCSQHHWLLTEVLRGEWGFDGTVVSDWWGTHDTGALDAGLDVEMPGPARHLGAGVAAAIEDGTLDGASLGRAEAAIRGLAARVGADSDHPAATEESVEDPADRSVIRRAATHSMVLLRNESRLLPLDEEASVALSGPNAARTAVMGGGSAAFVPHRRSDILAALQPRLGRLTHHRGMPAADSLPALECPGGFTVDHFDTPEPAGEPLLRERSLTSRLLWMGAPAPGVPEQGTSVRLRGNPVALEGGTHTFSLITGSTGWLAVDGRVVIDNRGSRRDGTAFFGMGSAEERATVELEEGQHFEVEAVTTPMAGLPLGGLSIGHAEPGGARPLETAVAAAAEADTAIVVVGGNDQWETEGRDRDGFALPEGQPELVRAICAANPRTVVVVNCGAPVDLSCAGGAAAILLCWYPGQEAGEAIADVLLGDAEPGGRLPTTWGRQRSDWASDANFPGDGSEVHYREGFSLGYRGFDRDGTDVEFCFGHGLGYADIEWSGPAVSHDTIEAARLTEGGSVEVGVELTNTSARPGHEVVQCYLAPTAGAALDDMRPPQWLAGFAKVALAPGEGRRATIEVGEVAFRRWESGWTIPTGDWELRISMSSRNHVFTLPVTTV